MPGDGSAWQTRQVIRIVTIAGLMSVVAAPASAQVPTFGSEECDAACSAAWVGGAIGATGLLLTEVVLIADGMIKSGHGHGLYETGAVLELILGLAHAAPVAISAWALATDPEPDIGFVSLGFASGVLSAYFLVHGLWSLTGGRPHPLPPGDRLGPHARRILRARPRPAPVARRGPRGRCSAGRTSSR